MQPITNSSLRSTCPLCSKKFSNMLYLDPCLHSFCFFCSQDLLESEVECPCCKEPFNSIFHPVRKKGCPEELLFSRRSKDQPFSVFPTEKHVKEHSALSSRKYMGKVQSFPFKNYCKAEIISSSEDLPISPMDLKRPLKFSSLKSLPKDNIPFNRFAKWQANCERQHLSALEEKATSDQVSQDSEPDESALRCTPEVNKSNLKRIHKPSSLRLSPKGNIYGSIKRQAGHECHHLHVLGKKPNTDQLFFESVEDENALSSIPELKNFKDDTNKLSHKAVPVNLSKPNMLEAVLLLFLAGLIVFICIYIYLWFAVLHR